MAENYVTLAEAAELEGVKRNTLVQRMKRNKDKYDARTEKNADGGWDSVEISVSSLSKKARDTWKVRQRVLQMAAGDPEDTGKPVERPWYVDCDLDWYMATYSSKYAEGMRLVGVVEQYIELDRLNLWGDKTEGAEEYAQENLGKSYRTLYRMVQTYREASAWARQIEKEQEISCEHFKVLALCRKPKDAGTFPSIAPPIKQAIKNIWFNKDFAANLGTREMLMEKLQLLAMVNHWEKIPSYPTVSRYIDYLMHTECMANAHALAARGMREYKNRNLVKGGRDTHSLKVMEIVMGDEHTFDCWVSYKQPNGKMVAIRPKLVAWIDVRSRMIMGDLVCKDANSDIIKQSILKMIYSDPGGVPEYLYIDNGKDYTAKTMTGVDRNVRVPMGREEGGELDDVMNGFYASVGIKDAHRALPYEPWNKGQIERAFGLVCQRFTKWFKSYTGTLTGSRTDAKVSKDINKMLERGELLTMEEFYEKWHEWLMTKYATRKHSGLSKAGELHTNPLACYEHAERYERALPARSFVSMLMLKSDNVLVRNIGIVRNNIEYRADELCDYIGRKVSIKWDPNDMARLYVFNREGKMVCEAYAQELLAFGSHTNEEALKEHKRRQNRQIREDKRRLEEAAMPFEELNEQYTGFSSTAGGMDLMIGKKPKRAKTIAFPQDRTYLEGFAGHKQEERETNEYMARQGAKALEALKALEN